MDPRILLCLCHMSGKELDFIQEAIDENWVVPLGPNVTGFEKDLEKFFSENRAGQKEIERKFGSQFRREFNEKRIVALSSGTAAIHLGLAGLGVERGDEVIVQSFTFSASANPVVYLGATPVFVDSEKETWNINPELLETAIKDRIEKTGRKPKAIIPVHLYGMPAQMDKILDVADKWEIQVLEDAAEAFGSEYNEVKCGLFGRFGALSFNGNKMITTSGGGALICPTPEEAARIIKYATQSREPYPWYQHEEIGYNYRLSNISAGIGRGQMTIAEQHIAHHRKIQNLYKEKFAGAPGIILHENPGPEFDSNFWLCTITLDHGIKIKGDDGCGAPEALRRILDKENIESRHLWKPMHLQPVFSDAPAYINGTSESLFERGLCLPSGPWVGEKEVEKISRTILSAIY